MALFVVSAATLTPSTLCIIHPTHTSLLTYSRLQSIPLSPHVLQNTFHYTLQLFRVILAEYTAVSCMLRLILDYFAAVVHCKWSEGRVD